MTTLKIANFYNNNLEVFGNSKIAVIIIMPQGIVIPILVNTKDNGYDSRPFSTFEATTKWILS